MTVPNGAKSNLARAVSSFEAPSVWAAGVALSPLLAGSVQRRAVAWGWGGKPSGPARNTDGQRWD